MLHFARDPVTCRTRCLWSYLRVRLLGQTFGQTDYSAVTRFRPTCKLDLCDKCATSIHSIKGLANHEIVSLQANKPAPVNRHVSRGSNPSASFPVMQRRDEPSRGQPFAARSPFEPDVRPAVQQGAGAAVAGQSAITSALMDRLMHIDTEREIARLRLSGTELLGKCFDLDCEREEVLQQILAQKNVIYSGW